MTPRQRYEEIPPPQRAARNFLDPWYCVPEMPIETADGKLCRMNQAPNAEGQIAGLYVEQLEALQALIEKQRIIVLKARKLGVSTITQAYLMHRAVTSPDAYHVLTVGHEEEACRTMNRMQSIYLSGFQKAHSEGGYGFGLGERLFQVVAQNTEQITIQRGNDKNKRSKFRTLQAGGRGLGRSFTSAAVHFTEAAHYPQGSSASGVSSKDTDETADWLVYSAATSSMYGGARSRIIIESSANGPSGMFYKKCIEAQEHPELWKFLFFPWFRSPAYQMDPWEGFVPTDEENLLAIKYGLTLRQLAWRRFKLTTEMVESRFRKEYPATPMDPFLISGGMWYPIDLLNDMLVTVDSIDYQRQNAWRIYRHPEANRKYFLGVDPSGGVGKDAAVIVVIDDLGHVCAVYYDTHTHPLALATEAAKGSLYYGRGIVLCEANRFGLTVCNALVAKGVNMWVTEHNLFWFTNPQNKLEIVTRLREGLENYLLQIPDPFLIRELMDIREQKNGNVEADEGKHDDMAVALALAWYAARMTVMTNVGRVTASMYADTLGESREVVMRRRAERVRQYYYQEAA